MIDGIHILSEYIHYKNNWIICCIIAGFMALLMFILIKLLLKEHLFYCILFSFMIFMTVCAILGGSNSKLNQLIITNDIDYIEYKCLISDDVNFNDILDHYEIVEVTDDYVMLKEDFD